MVCDVRGRVWSDQVRERETGIHTEEALRKRFKSLDDDDSGYLEMPEFIKFSLREAMRRTKARVTDLLHDWDRDCSGQIDILEFRKLIWHLGFDATEEARQLWPRGPHPPHIIPLWPPSLSRISC